MDLRTTEKLALELMAKHGLDKTIWSFKWDNSKKRFGVCKYSFKSRFDRTIIRGIIGLSRHLVELNDEPKVRDTILHEIAHALCPGQGHNIVWKRKCIEIGAIPIRCYSSKEVETPTMRYQAVCDGCQTLHQKTKIVKPSVKRSCNCQRGKAWDERILLTFVDTKILT